MSIPVLVERARGLYIVAPALNAGCGRFPAAVVPCASCGQGIRPARGFTWVHPEDILDAQACRRSGPSCTSACPMSAMGPLMAADRAGLLWIGEGFYPTPESFLREAAEMGVSRRLAQLPRGFMPGETWVMLGHRKAIKAPCPECCQVVPGMFGPTIPPPRTECDACDGTGWVYKPGVIAAFKSEAVQYVCTGDETEDELDRIRARALTPVMVQRAPVELPAAESAQVSA